MNLSKLKFLKLIITSLLIAMSTQTCNAQTKIVKNLNPGYNTVGSFVPNNLNSNTLDLQLNFPNNTISYSFLFTPSGGNITVNTWTTGGNDINGNTTIGATLTSSDRCAQLTNQTPQKENLILGFGPLTIAGVQTWNCSAPYTLSTLNRFSFGGVLTNTLTIAVVVKNVEPHSSSLYPVPTDGPSGGVISQNSNNTLSQRIIVTTATSLKNAAGNFHTLTINTGAAGTITVSDLNAAACTGTPAATIASITVTATTPPTTLIYDWPYTNGLCVKASIAMDISVTAN